MKTRLTSRVYTFAALAIGFVLLASPARAQFQPRPLNDPPTGEAYHIEGDPEGRTFGEILVDVVATEVIEPWGGGKWHLEIFRAANPDPEDWNGEM